MSTAEAPSGAGERLGGRSPARVVLAFALAFGGLFPLLAGYVIGVRSEGASQVPAEVELESLEQGQLPGDRHVRVGRHLALFQVTAVWASATADMSNPDTHIDVAWYPVLSARHAQRQQFEGTDALEPSALKDVALLVETRRFSTMGAIPSEGLWRDSLQGLTVGKAGALPRFQRETLTKAYPLLDPDRILVLEEGVVPPRADTVRGLLAVGGLLFILGLAVGLPRRAWLAAIPVPSVPRPASVLRFVGKLALAGALVVLALASGLMAERDWYLFGACGPEPMAVDLASIEKGAGVPNPYLRLDRHLALLQAAVPIPRRGAPEGPVARLAYAYVPLVSGTHPAMAKLRELGEAFGGPEGIPRDKLPPLGPLGVLVQTRRYPTAGDLPLRGQWRDQVEGVVVGTAAQDVADRPALLAAFPGLDLRKVQDLREGRLPPAWWEALAGALLAVSALAVALWVLLPRR